MSFSDASAKETYINDNYIEDPNYLSITLFQHMHEDVVNEHRAPLHGDSSHNYHHDCSRYSPTAVSGAKMSDGTAISDIALNISQPPVQRYIKFPTTSYN